MMLVYGYEWSSEKDLPDTLKEASLVCTKDELDVLITFLQDIRAGIADMSTVEGAHWHLRDWDATWTKDQSDFIVSLSDKW